MHPFITIAALGYMAIAAVSDLRERRISNRLNLTAAVTGLSLQLALGGVDALLAGLHGFGVGLGVMFLPFLAGMIGGGDVKFAAAAGTFLGWKLLLSGLAVGVLLGGVSGAISLAKHRRFKAAMRGLFTDLLCLATGVRPTTLKSTETVETVPYGVLLAVGMGGMLCAALLRWVPWVSL